MTTLFEGFETRSFSALGSTKPVHVAGTGPAVIVLHEFPSIEPTLMRFARFVRDAGFTAHVPQLFGVPNDVQHDGFRPVDVMTGLHVCVSREFHVFASDRSSPITDWLRALARDIHPTCGGRAVGVIGMCFTGGFVLSMLLEPVVGAGVMAQPGLPLKASGMQVSPDELAAVKARLTKEDFTVKCYRFERDRLCQPPRMARYAAGLGDRLEQTVLPSSAANRDEPLAPHSTVTRHLIDRPGEPTRQAVDEILRYFGERLRPA